MRRLLFWSAILLGGFSLIGGAVGYGVYGAITAMPEEYAAALQVDPQHQEEQRQELESRIAALYSDAQPLEEEPEPIDWETLVTDDQINGWLATRLVEEMPEIAEQGVIEPRVLFVEEGLTLAFRLKQGGVNVVVMFRVTPFVAEDGRLGVELIDTRVGTAPIPTSRIVEATRPLLADAGLPVEWSTIEDRPALLFEFESLASDKRRRRTLKAIDVSEGKLYVAGQSEVRSPRLARGVSREEFSE